MKNFALPLLLVLFSLSNAATIERNEEENEVIPRKIKQKENNDTVVDKTDKIMRVLVIHDGKFGHRILPNKTTPSAVIKNGSRVQVKFFYPKGPSYPSREFDNPSEIETPSEEFRSATKESDKKSEFPRKRYYGLKSNENQSEKFKIGTNYHEDLDLRTHLLQGGDKHEEESDSNAAVPEILLNPNFEHHQKFEGALNSKEKQSVKGVPNGTNFKAFGIEKEQSEITSSKEDHSTESTSKKNLSIYILRLPYLKITKPLNSDEESSIVKYDKNIHDILHHLPHDTPLYVYLENPNPNLEKFQNLSKSEVLEELESLKNHTENVKPMVKDLSRMKGEYPNFASVNKPPVAIVHQRRFPEMDESQDKYLGASKLQENKREKVSSGKPDLQEMHTLTLNHQGKLPDDIELPGKHPKSVSKSDVEKLVLERKRQDLDETRERDEHSTIQPASITHLPDIQSSILNPMKSQDAYSERFDLQEKDFSAVKLTGKHRQSTPEYPAFRMKRNHRNVSKAIQETSTKRGHILNLGSAVGKNATEDSEIVISIPIPVDDFLKLDNISSKQANPLDVEKNTGMQIKIHLELSFSSEKNKTNDSKDKVPDETYGDKNSFEDSYALQKNHNENIRVKNNIHRRNLHKSTRAVEPLWLVDHKNSKRLLRKKLESPVSSFFDENKSRKRRTIRTKKSVPKLKPKTENETNTEAKREGGYETTTEKRTSLEDDDKQKNNLTTEKTIEQNATLNVEIESTSLMSISEILKQENAESDNLKSAEIDEVKYRGISQPSEEIDIPTSDNKRQSFDVPGDSTTLKHESALNNTMKKTEFKDQNETLKKPMQEISEGNTDESKKDNKTSATSGLLSTNESKTDTVKSGNMTAKTALLYRKPNIMTEATIQENITVNNDNASTLQISNNTEKISSKNGNPEVKKSTVFREDKTTTESITVKDKESTNDRNTANKTTSKNLKDPSIEKSKDVAPNPGAETTTKDIHDEGAVKTEYTRSIDENSTAKIESFLWTGMDGLYKQPPMEYRNADRVNKEMIYRHKDSMATVQEPTANKDKNGDKSSDELVEKETEKQISKKRNESELVEPTRSDSRNNKTQTLKHPEVSGKKMNVSHINQSPKNISGASSSSKEKTHRLAREIKTIQEKETGDDLNVTTVSNDEHKIKEKKKLFGISKSGKHFPG